MGKKFGFHLAPLKIPNKSENDAIKKALDGEFSPLPTPVSPLIDRQSISRAVEAELKDSCKILVEKTGNAHHNSQEDAIVNFSSLQRAAQLKNSVPKKASRPNDGHTAKELGPVGQADRTELPKRASSLPPKEKPDEASPAVPAPPLPNFEPKSTMAAVEQVANETAPEPEPEPEPQVGLGLTDGYESGDDDAEEIESAIQATKPAFPPRRDSLCSQKHASLHGSVLSLAIEPSLPPLPPSVAHAAQDSVSSSCDISVGDASPITASTDNQARPVSTAPTTVAATPAHRVAKEELVAAVPTVGPVAEDPNPDAGSAAPLERKASELTRENLPTSKQTTTHTPATPADERVPRSKKSKASLIDKNVVTEIKDFVKNRARSRSRSREPGSFRRATSMSLESIRSSWHGLRRKSSMFDIPAPPGTAHANEPGLVDNASSSRIDVHRELPPLPSLDVLKQAQAEQEKDQQVKKEAESTAQDSTQLEEKAQPTQQAALSIEQTGRANAVELVNSPVELPADTAFKEPASEPTEEAAERSSEQTVKQPLKDSVRETIKDTVKVAVKQAVSATAKAQRKMSMKSLKSLKDAQTTAETPKVPASVASNVAGATSELKPASVASAVPEPSPEPSNIDKLKINVQSDAASTTPPPSENIVEQKLDAEMKKLDAQKKQAVVDTRIRRTTVHIVTAQRPKTSGGPTPTTRSRAGTETLLRPTYRARSSSLKSVRKPSVSVCTATMVPVRTVRKLPATESDAASRDKDSMTDSDDEGSKNGSEVGKAARVVHKPSMDSVRQINIKSRRNTTASALPQSYAPSQASSSRPQSRAALAAPASGSRTPNSVRYTIIPHQRTPSQPIYLSRSAASSIVNIPARPVTRDSSGMQMKSRMPSVATRNDLPPLPPNFSRKIVDGSRPTTSAGTRDAHASMGDFSALPQFQSKKPLSFRRMLSSINLKKMKTLDLRWPSRGDGRPKTAMAPIAVA